MDQLADAFNNLANSMSEHAKFGRKFNGENNEDVKFFIEGFEYFCELNGKNLHYKQTTFPMHLQGRAHKLYSSLPDYVKDDYDLMIEHMKNLFSPVHLPPLQAYEKLRTVKKTSNESVQDLYEKIIDCARDLEVTEAQLMSTFISNLPKADQKFLELKEPDTLAMALKLAKQRETVGSSESEKELVKKAMKKVEKFLASQSEENIAAVTTAEKEFTCMYCGSSDHYAAYCPMDVSRQDNCQYCGCDGHDVSICNEFARAQSCPPTSFCK